MDKREMLYMLLILGSFGGFMAAMILLTLQEKAWLRRTGQKRD